jgi:signal transduction histidine kinase
LLRGVAIDLLILHVVGVTVLFLVAFNRLDATVEDLEARDMREIARDLGERLKARGLADIDLRADDLARFSPGYGRYVFAVLDQEGRVLVSSTGTDQALAPIEPTGTEPAARFKAQGQTALLWGVSVPVTVGQRRVWIQVAEDMNHRDAVIDEVATGFLKQGGGWLLALSVAQILISLIRIRRLFRPLLAASDSAAAIAPHIGSGRIRCDGVPREILPLVEAINDALGRVETAFRAQKEFLETAAHELRTPLSVLRARIETVADVQMRTELETDVAVLTRLVTQLLRAAEMEGLADTQQTEIDLSELAATVAAYLRPAARMSGRSIAISSVAGARVHGCAETIGQAINNLVENALSHAPPGTGVEVSITADPPEIRVRDHGPGVPVAERDLVFQRFWRRDRRKGTGAGLGLAMVRRAMDLHKGRVWVEDAPGGGAVFVLVFPPHFPSPQETGRQIT